MAKKCCYNKKNYKFFFWQREDEDKSMVKRMVKFELFFIPKLSFWAYIYIYINTFTFWCMVIPMVHIQFTPSERPKGFVN